MLHTVLGGREAVYNAMSSVFGSWTVCLLIARGVQYGLVDEKLVILIFVLMRLKHLG